LDTGKEITEDVSLGEFFGVKSALGKYPREETAQTIGETTVLILRSTEFEKFILSNIPIVQKMLRVFSNQLRRIHKMVRNVLGQAQTADLAVELFNLGEYYYKNGVYNQAMYAYKRYMEYYADNANAAKAMKRINEIETGDYKPDMGPEKPQDDSPDEDREPAYYIEEPPNAESELISELDNFFSEEEGLPDSDDFSMDEQANSGGRLEEAEAMFGQKRFDDALSLYREALDSGELMDDDDIVKVYLGIGRCCVELKNGKEAVQSFSAVVKNYPSAAGAKEAYFEIGALFESNKQKDKALQYYKKAAGMQPNDALSGMAMKKIKELQGGEKDG
jgi:tetratricopeptide (TPR) repeat protein